MKVTMSLEDYKKGDNDYSCIMTTNSYIYILCEHHIISA